MYLATSLAAPVIRVGFVEWVYGFVSLQMFRKELVSGGLCDERGHGSEEERVGCACRAGRVL